MRDVAIIGAGLAGLTCGRWLQAAGYQVCVLDKSRGLGGRMATRRVTTPGGATLRVDHGLRYWQPATAALQALTDELLSAGIIQPWPVTAYEIRQREVLSAVEQEPVYAAAGGMSAIAKYLARDFTPGEQLLTNHRAIALAQQNDYWTIECEGGESIAARRCAIAIPAPQAADLLSARSSGAPEPRANFDRAIAALRAVEYFPCLSVLAGYSDRARSAMTRLNPQGWMVADTVGTSTAWAGLDSSKRPAAPAPVVVIHSKPAFAQRYLDASDLQPAASVLLRANARKLGDWVAQPEWFQIHRWRYAHASEPYPAAILSVTPTLACGGDWCSPPGDEPQNIDAAYTSGLALAQALAQTGAGPGVG